MVTDYIVAIYLGTSHLVGMVGKKNSRGALSIVAEEVKESSGRTNFPTSVSKRFISVSEANRYDPLITPRCELSALTLSCQKKTSNCSTNSAKATAPKCQTSWPSHRPSTISMTNAPRIPLGSLAVASKRATSSWSDSRSSANPSSIASSSRLVLP